MGLITDIDTFSSREELAGLINKLEDQRDAPSVVPTSAETSRSVTPCPFNNDVKSGK